MAGMLRELFAEHTDMVDDVMALVTKYHKGEDPESMNFDQAASVGMRPCAITAQVVANLLLTANSNSPHAAGQYANAVNLHCRKVIGQMVGSGSTNPNNCLFTDGGAAANRTVFDVILPQKPRQLGGGLLRDTVIVGQIEHPSVLEFTKALPPRGFNVAYLPIDRDRGVYDCDALRKIIAQYKHRIALLTVHHVNNEIGTMQPLADLSRVLRASEPDAVLHSDCVQSFGKVPVDIKNWGVDVVTISFHKVGGPKRCGALVASKDNILPVMFKATEDTSDKLAAIVAAQECLAQIPEKRDNCLAMRDRIMTTVQRECHALNMVYRELSQPPPVGAPGIVSFLFPGLQGAHFVSMLSEYGISASSGSACSAQNEEASKVVQSLRVSGEDWFSVLRLSFGGDESDTQGEKLAAALVEVLHKLQPSQKRELVKRRYNEDWDEEVPNYRNPMRKARVTQAADSATNGLCLSEWGIESDERCLELLETTIKHHQPGYDAVMLTFGELVLKGSNRNQFEKLLKMNIKNRLTSDPLGKELRFWTPSGYPQAGFVLLYLGDPVKDPQAHSAQGDSENGDAQHSVNSVEENEASENGTPTSVQSPLDSEPSATTGKKTRNGKRPPKTKPVKGKPKPPPPDPPTIHRRITIEEFHNILVPMLRTVSGLATVVGVMVTAPTLDAVRQGAFDFVVQDHGKLVDEFARKNGVLRSVNFRLRGRRIEKDFPMESSELMKRIASNLVIGFEEYIKKTDDDTFPPLTVNLSNPDVFCEFRIRREVVIIFSPLTSHITAVGGLPHGADSRANVLCLLSGGHDSPIACFRSLQRGCRASYIHFDGFPYVGKEVVLKVRKLAQALNSHQAVRGTLHVVPFAKIQEKIAGTPNIKESYRTVLYRVFMFKLAAIVARKGNFSALVTGDSLGQVASQTLTNMSLLDSYSDMFVVRPLVTTNKQEILDQCKGLNVFNITKMYGTADCCTVFMPSNPILEARKSEIDRMLTVLDEAGIDDVIQECIKGIVQYKNDTDELILPADLGMTLPCPFKPKPKLVPAMNGNSKSKRSNGRHADPTPRPLSN